MAFDKTGYDREYVKDNYKRISVYIPKSREDDLKALAKSKGKSVNQLIIDALFKAYQINLSK